jgi:phosphoglycolate phosphatase-like HAD superfamily hydrolase
MALRAARTSRFFRAIITIDDVRKKKPAPDALCAALRRMKVASAWMVGDGPADLLAAQRARVPAVAVRRPDSVTGSDPALREYAPLALIDRAEELVGVFEQRDQLARDGAP